MEIPVWKRIRRTPYQSFASVFMMFVTLFVMGIFILFTAVSSSLLYYFETKPQLTVFFKNEADKTLIDNLQEKLKATGKVVSVKFISKEEALAIYREQNKEDPLLLEMVTADILPSSLEVSATNPKHLQEFNDMLINEKGIENIVYQKDVVDTLLSWTSTLRMVGFLFVFLLAISTFFILMTTISMRIAMRKEEIEILRLVGATNSYIKSPFVKEGFLYGFIGSLSSSVLISFTVLYLRPFMSTFFQGIEKLTLFSIGDLKVNIWPPNILITLLLWILLLLSGLGIGFFGSLLATSRYMKE